MKKREKLLLGFTNVGEVVFANVEYRNGMFSVSFDTSYPMEVTHQSMVDSAESTIECMDKEWVLDRLEEYDCKPSELAEELVNNPYHSVEDFFDNSLYTESFSIDGFEDEIYFISSCCGQHDTRDDMSIYVNYELYHAIHQAWDDYHLKNVDFSKLEDIFEAIKHERATIDEYKVIEQYLRNHKNKIVTYNE